MSRRSRALLVAMALAGGLASGSAAAIEYPIGTPQQRYGMEIAAVYLQPVTMEPEGMMAPPEKSDVHLEADIHALASNPWGFSEGGWMPYLKIDYTLVKEGSSDKKSGELMAMTANDGPHYGDNVKLFGPGKYRLTFHISPPNSPGSHAQFGRHTDRLTGVRPWFKPFDVDFEFTFVGIGKKGGY